MPRLQFRLATVLWTVAATALLSWGLLCEPVSHVIYCGVWLFAFVAGLCGAIYDREKRRAFWLGFVVVWGLPAWNKNSPFPMSFAPWLDWLTDELGIFEYPQTTLSVGIGRYCWLLLVLLLSITTGMVSYWIYRRIRQEQ